jgi:ABC-2 type transport system ATP-binding protein
MTVLIEAHNLRKVFGDTVAVANLDLQVTAGEIYGLVGPDGAGKTTSMRLMCGALQPTRDIGAESASISIGGYDVIRETEHARSQIGYLPQRFSLYEELTVMENLRFFAEVRGLPSAHWKPRCMQILEFVGLDQFTGRRAGFLSGGMKQKLGLAAALVHRPRVLLLDEPTTGVDPVTRQDFWQLIISLVANNNNQGNGVAVLVSTPYMDEAARCSRVGFMRDGLLIVEGPPAKLRAMLDGRILELRGSPLRLLRQISEQDIDVESVQMFGDRMHMRIHEGKAQEVVSRLKNRIEMEGIDDYLLRPVPSQLEDVFNLLLEQEVKAI